VNPTTLLCLAALALPLGAAPETLTPLDAQLLLERLKKLRAGSEQRIEARYKSAHGAFRDAIASDNAAHGLYLKCIEKVQFEDEKKKASEFRDWKRRHKERGDSPAFRRALRHQLSWLLLTLEAASDPDKQDELWPKAVERIDQIFKDAKELKGEQSRLRQSVLASVFATAYGLNGIKIEGWPTAPLELDVVYEQLIFPPLRKRSKIPQLRSAWEKRILHEGSVHSEWGRPANARGVRQERSADLERFLAERRPQLLWDMEVDLFKTGDQKGAALRMLAHIEKNDVHKNTGEWIVQFEELVKGKSRPAPVSGTAESEPEKEAKGKEPRS